MQFFQFEPYFGRNGFSGENPEKSSFLNRIPSGLLKSRLGMVVNYLAPGAVIFPLCSLLNVVPHVLCQYGALGAFYVICPNSAVSGS